MDMEPETQVDIESRIARAQSQEMEIEVVSDNPLVVEVANRSSGRIHTVLPETVYCSCEDHTYRDSLCKHLIFVADGSDYIAEELRQSMTDDLLAMQSEAQELRSRLREIESKQAQYTAVRESLDTVLQYSDPDTDRTETESEATDEESETMDDLVERVIEANPEDVADYRSGENGALNYLIGQVMQETGGSIRPSEAKNRLENEIDRDTEPEEHSEFRRMVSEISDE